MKRKGTIFRTAFGEENVNRLRVPEFGVRKLAISVGEKASLSHLPKNAPRPDTEDEGSDDFHFVPELEELGIKYEIFDPLRCVEKAKLELYRRHAKKAMWTLDLAVLGADWMAPGVHVVKWDGRIVKAEQEQAGTATEDGFEHDLTSIEPDKSIKAFPDGYVTLEHTPYMLRLSLVGSDELVGNSPVAWTHFHILVKSLELELGDEKTIPATSIDNTEHKRNKAIRAKIEADGGLPAAGSERKIFLISNLFKTDGAQMRDNTAFSVYRTMFGHGPQIPIFAKVRLADSTDAEVELDESDKGAVALGNVNFLWDWEDPDEDVDGVQGEDKPKAFIKSAIDYCKDGTDSRNSARDHTYPKGDNCHVDRGGKRGPGARPVFPNQSGYDPKDTLDTGKFPFFVKSGYRRQPDAPEKRRWGSFSRAWTSGALKGKTGVVFQPSRMAGDDYVLNVYVAYDKTSQGKLVLDAQDEPLEMPATIKKSTGTVRIWREIHVSRYIRKGNAIASFWPGQMGAVHGHYHPAYIEVEDKVDAKNSYLWSEHRNADGNAPDYNGRAQALLNASGRAIFTNHLATENNADHAGDESAFKVRSYADFVKAVHARAYAAVPAAATDFADWASDDGSSEEDLASGLGRAAVGGWANTPRNRRLKAVRSWLRSEELDVDTKYARHLDNSLFSLAKRMARQDLALISGGKRGETPGAAQGITILHFNYSNSCLRELRDAGANVGSKLGSAIDADDADRSTCAFVFAFAAVDTFSHEIGHHMFLPHAPTAPGFQVDRHDEADGNCLMSYTRPRPSFCGLCQLRLRGWDARRLDKDLAKNKRPRS